MTFPTEPSLYFHHLPTGNRLDVIWPLLEQGDWKHFKPEAHERNTLQGLLNRSACLPVIPDILPIYPGMVWSNTADKLLDPRFKPEIRVVSYPDIVAAAAALFSKFSDRHIGVQLSGGLDSSIIIALLRHLDIRFSLVGMTTARYEFRTERHIQDRLAQWGANSVLIDYEEHLPLSQLDVVPMHQHPDLFSLNYASNKAMARACEELGIEVLFTGNGGDNVFADALSTDPAACSWMPQVFVDSWLDDLVYAPSGVQVVPFYADRGILNIIYNLRAGQGIDSRKQWARNFFSDLLPQELVEFTYCADFWGLYIDGLSAALPTVRHLFKRAYDMTLQPCFSSAAMDKLLGQDLLRAEKTTYQRIEARVSLAVWLNTLAKSAHTDAGQARTKVATSPSVASSAR